jgi:hypothetical protein
MRTNALRFLTKLFLGFLLVLPFAASAETHEHYRGGGQVVIIPRYSYAYPYWGWGWGGPFWDDGPYYYENTGWIKIKDPNKSDEVLVNGAYAGTVAKMKTMKLSPGNYTIQIRREGKELLNRSIYVVVGKTVEINLDGG